MAKGIANKNAEGRMQEKITDRFLSKFQRSDEFPPARRLVIHDSELRGFGVVVQPSGVMSFILRYRRQPDGARRDYKIGRAGKYHGRGRPQRSSQALLLEGLTPARMVRGRSGRRRN
ncbi:MAG: hypothetical protein U5O39_00450 [Gammaproteobacteria bacterium]|nr:hypothetical protein [Gammaproteobacteria bacterium]